MAIIDSLNRPLHDLRISLIDRCNFRCPYCMPSEKFHHAYRFLDKDRWLSFDEIVRLARIFVGLGGRKLRLTGGEPLLRPEIDRLVRQLAAVEGIEDLALTTNGSMLSLWAARLKAAGLHRLTVSLDTLDESVFYRMNGEKAALKEVLDGLRAAEQAGFKAININAVIQRGVNDHTILDLVRYFRGTPHTLRFIEYMDVGNQNHWDDTQVVPSSEIISMINAEFPLRKIGGTQDGGTSEIFCFKDGEGEVAFISSVTKAFCGTCRRLRLSADGKLYTCLFATRGTDLGGPLRKGASDEILGGIIRQVWTGRDDRYSETRYKLRHGPQALPKVEMYQIGG
ncbi:MAG: GTP 3',8-cyclase MoaA [Candidatus Omnitrophica bacterium]|nr:GTP 3',8-cyclase MoaA [Candidatus Omnitrophota bacterium]